MPERIREAVRIVEEKATPEEAEEYRQFILRLADVVAHAHKEGGVLGIGGKEVSRRSRPSGPARPRTGDQRDVAQSGSAVIVADSSGDGISGSSWSHTNVIVTTPVSRAA